MARPNGGLEDRGMPGASHRPPTSSSTSTRRPCRHPRRSFPSCPVAVPAPPRDRGKVAPSRSEAAGPTLGRGARRVGRGVAPPMVGGGAEAEAPVPLAGSSREPRLQAAGRGRGMGGERARWRREETGGGSRRRGGRRGGRADPGWVEGALEGGLSGRSLPAPRASALALLPVFFPASEPPEVRETVIWGLRDSGKDPCRNGRAGSHGGELGRGGTSRLQTWSEHRDRGPWAPADRSSRRAGDPGRG